jgi:hypothetical protein
MWVPKVKGFDHHAWIVHAMPHSKSQAQAKYSIPLSNAPRRLTPEAKNNHTE